ncbi:MAG: endolytic transglycosylase MltG [Halioglobus sp.]
MRRLLAATLLLLLLLGAAAAQVKSQWEKELAVPAGGYFFTVEAGDSLAGVAERLQSAGILEQPVLLRAYGRWTGVDQQIKRGEYRLATGATAETLLELLERGDVISYTVTLPEGITLARALEILNASEQLNPLLKGVDDPRIVELVAPRTVAEGMFLPETYRFERGDSDWDVLQRAHQDLLNLLGEEWAGRDLPLPYETPYEALIMASIIERETGAPHERAEIAGVFTRRLQKRMRLQTDPTVIYGLGPGFDGNLRRRHLVDSSNPYNSYKHHGLPPSPIALPGRAAIHAAMHPAAGDTLYFVARGDGSHKFSETLEAHQEAVRKYQLRRRQDYRSTPQSN